VIKSGTVTSIIWGHTLGHTRRWSGIRTGC